MRFWRASLAAGSGAVVFLSLFAPGRVVAEERSVRSGMTVRMEAIGAVPARPATRPGKPGLGRHAATGPAGETRPVPLIFVDDETPWIMPPDPPPDLPPEATDTAGVLQCVPYARFVSGIGLRGDAWTWWDQAAGVYARGNLPEPGAILSFPGIERMPLGHIAVVRQVLTARKILIDHANWPNAVVRHGAISRDILVVDVSPANNWTEVRVQFGEGGPMGSVYPANGFIYGWSEAGVRIAQPKFALDYALWSPVAPSWRMFTSTAYLWALPPAERKKAYAAASLVPNAGSAPRPMTALAAGSGPGGNGPGGNGPGGNGPGGNGMGGNAMARPIGTTRLDLGLSGRPAFVFNRFVLQ